MLFVIVVEPGYWFNECAIFSYLLLCVSVVELDVAVVKVSFLLYIDMNNCGGS